MERSRIPAVDRGRIMLKDDAAHRQILDTVGHREKGLPNAYQDIGTRHQDRCRRRNCDVIAVMNDKLTRSRNPGRYLYELRIARIRRILHENQFATKEDAAHGRWST